MVDEKEGMFWPPLNAAMGADTPLSPMQWQLYYAQLQQNALSLPLNHFLDFPTSPSLFPNPLLICPLLTKQCQSPEGTESGSSSSMTTSPHAGEHKDHEIEEVPKKLKRRSIGILYDEDEEEIDVESLRDFGCQMNECAAKFTTEKALVRHIAHEHARKKDDLTCAWRGCWRAGKPFDAHHALVLHVRSHTGEKPYECNFGGCSKRYSRLENLKTHRRAHTGERPYACAFPGCASRFTNSSDQSKHHNITHMLGKSYVCVVEACAKTYMNPSSLRKHIITAHGKLVYEEKRKHRPSRPTGVRRNKIPIKDQILMGILVKDEQSKKYYTIDSVLEQIGEVSKK